MPGDAHITLVRHGQSEANAGLVTEAADTADLTPLGILQARAIAALFDAPPARVVCSPYERARRTAAFTIARFPDTPVEEWAVQEFTFLDAEAFSGTTLAERREATDAYWEGAHARVRLGPGAESFADFLERVAAARSRLQEAQGRLVVFSHKKFITALVWSLLGGAPVASSRGMRRYRGFDRALDFPNGAALDLFVRGSELRIGPVRVDHLPEANR